MSHAYYHEYAHLVQRSPINRADHSEDNASIPSPAEVPESHAREMDADWLATNIVALQLTGAFTDEESRWIGGNGADLVTLASVALCSIFCFFVQAAQRYTDVYFGERVHPHPLIRIAFIAQYMGKVIRKNLPDSIEFDEARALRKALSLAERMLTPVYGDAVARLAEQLDRHYADIERYGNQIIDKALSMPGMCGSRPPMEL